jgi:hypothetical protein
MTEDELREIFQRISWLERKMVRLIWTLSQIIGAVCAWVIASAIANFFGAPQYGIVWLSAAIPSYIGIGIAAARSELKGAPSHVKYIDP